MTPHLTVCSRWRMKATGERNSLQPGRHIQKFILRTIEATSYFWLFIHDTLTSLHFPKPTSSVSLSQISDIVRCEASHGLTQINSTCPSKQLLYGSTNAYWPQNAKLWSNFRPSGRPTLFDHPPLPSNRVPLHNTGIDIRSGQTKTREERIKTIGHNVVVKQRAMGDENAAFTGS